MKNEQLCRCRWRWPTSSHEAAVSPASHQLLSPGHRYEGCPWAFWEWWAWREL